MNPIIEALNTFADAQKCLLTGGFTKEMTESRLDFPLIWYEPPVLIRKKGEQEGFITYKIRLHLLEKNRNLSAEDHQKIREKLEQRVIFLCDSVTNHPKIRTVELISCTPEESARTNYGEISVAAHLEIDTIFCRNCNTEDQ